MLKSRNTKILKVIIVLIFSITFYFGVFANPNFNIHDFCMNLSTEILGIVFALVIIESYVKAIEKDRESKKEKSDLPSS